MKLISNLKRAGYIGSALVLGLAAVPVTPMILPGSENVSALELSEAKTLDADVTDGIVVTAGSTVTLDLNGHNITNSATGQAAIINKGNLTITGSGNVSTEQAGTAAVTNYPGATLTISGGSYTSAKWYIIRNYGTMTINDGATVAANAATSSNASMVTNGWVGDADANNGESIVAGTSTPSLTINGGAFTAGATNCSVIKNDDYGVLNISGGTFKQPVGSLASCGTVILNWNVATISGGTFYSENGPVLSNGSYGANSADKGQLTVNGGTFTSGANGSILGTGNGGTPSAGVMNITDGEFDGPMGRTAYAVNVSGGTYSDANVSAENIATGMAAYKSGNKYVIEPKITNDIFANTPDAIDLKEGEAFDVSGLNIALPNGSTSALGFYVRPVNGETVASVDKFNATKITGEKLGTTSMRVNASYDTSVYKDINIVVKSGLKELAIDDVTMLQEGEKTLDIEDVYYYDRASEVTYTATSSDEKVQAIVEDNTLRIVTGQNGKVEPGEYTVTVKALVNGEETNISKDVIVTVNKLFTDFTIAQADANNVIKIKENEYFTLKISGASEDVVDKSNVKITSVEVTDGGDVLRANEDRITGRWNGVGSGKIVVTAEYTSGDNAYTATKEFGVNVVTALKNIAVRDADDSNNSGVKYGMGTGETGEISFDKDESKELKVSINEPTAAVEIEVTSSDENIATVEFDESTKTFKLSGANEAGEATISVKVTPKGADDSAALVKTFAVKVNPILETVTANDIIVDQGGFGQIVATVNDDLEVTYTYEVTDNVKRVTVEEDGRFATIAGKKGTATIKITATDAKGRMAETTMKIKINPVLNSVTVKNSDIVIYEDETDSIEIEKVDADSIKNKVVWSYEGYDESIISVDADGKITPIKDGWTVVTLRGVFVSPLENRYEVTAQVRVTVKPLLTRVRIRDAETKVTLNGSTQTLYELDENTYAITHENKNAPVEYRAESSDEAIATAEVVDGKLEVKTFEKTGATTVTVYAKDTESGKEVSAKMTVVVKPTLKSVSAEDLSLVAGNDAQIVKAYTNVEIAESDVTFAYESADATIATVDANGKVTGVAGGKTTVKVTASYDGKTVDTEATVNVYEMVAPTETEFYGEAGTEFAVDVHDKNELGVVEFTVEGMEGGLTVDGDNVTANKPGKYTVTYTDKMADGETVGTYTATFEIYGLEVTFDDKRILEIGDDFEYAIDTVKTYGEVKTAVTRDGEQIAQATGTDALTIDTAEEGEYIITVTNTAAAEHGFSEVATKTFCVYAWDEDYVFVKAGETVTILPAGERWSVDFAEDFYTDEEVDVTDGKVVLDTANMELGYHHIHLYHDFGDGDVATLKCADVVVYSIETADDDTDDDEGVAAKTLEEIIRALVDAGIAEDYEAYMAALANAQTVFGEHEWMSTLNGLEWATMTGEAITTKVDVREIEDTEEVDEALLSKIDELNVDGVIYYDVNVLISAGDQTIGRLHQLNDKITVAIAEVTDLESGYAREWIVVRMHEGEEPVVLVEGEDFYIENGVLYIISDKFSTYAVAYKDTLLPVVTSVTNTASTSAPNTGAVTREAASASANLSMAAVAAMAVITLAGAAVIAKRK